MDKTENNFFKLIPQLLERVKALIDKIEKRDAIYAQILQQKQEAKISDEELQRLVSTIEDAVRRTHCAAPDTTDCSRLIAKGVISEVKQEVKESVKETVSTTRVPVEHLHTHTTLCEMSKLVDETTRRWLLGLTASCIALLLLLLVGGIYVLNTNEYLGMEWRKICCSDYTTAEERAFLVEDWFSTGFIPKEYKDKPKLLKDSIRRNKEILKQRKHEAKERKGKFTMKTPLVR